jgi:hypothetical protein
VNTYEPSAVIIIVWTVLYAMSIILLVAVFVKKASERVNVIVNFASFVVNVFAPSLAIVYVEKLNLAYLSADVAIVVHVVFTLLSCSTLVAWGIILAAIGMWKGGLKPVEIFILEICPIAAFLTIVVAIWDPAWFICRDNYLHDIRIWYIWPGTIKAPISYFRITLAVLIFGVTSAKGFLEKEKEPANS